MQIPQDKAANSWYNKCKGKSRKRAKTLHLEGGHVSLQQWTDQLDGFQAAGWHESEGEQSLGQESPNDSLDGDRDAVCGSVPQPKGECGQAAAAGSGSLHHPGGVWFF